ncbi:MAG: response regulator [Melioribacteraceae bacterium]|nr:response regulator [Melioribacteraceae bacterium]
MTKILVIEDDKSVKENLSKILTVHGYDVRAFESGTDALDHLKEALPDIIICDIMLPDMDGYQILETISADPIMNKVPFIFLTAKVEMTDLRKGMNLGADDYITKPFHIKDLLDAIQVRLSKSRLKAVDVGSLNDEPQRYNENQRIFLPDGSDMKFVTVGDIKFITADGPYSYINTTGEKNILVRKLLKDWESILPLDIFLRIHKSTIINLKWIVKIEKWFNNSYRIFLKDLPEPFIISRRFAKKLRETFKP